MAWPRIYRYVVAYDGGTAPRPFGGVCSLAICKPRIRAAAEPGDWIIGFRSRHPGEVVYVMQVAERMSLGDYWQDARFSDRKPDVSAYPDNIYRPDRYGGLEQVSNPVHQPENAQKDMSGKNVLLGRRFWYFGRDSVPLPNHLMHLVQTTQGHAVHKNRRPDDCEQLTRWLASWPTGMLGKPIDREIDLDKSGIDSSAASSGRRGSHMKYAAEPMPTLIARSQARSCSTGSRPRSDVQSTIAHKPLRGRKLVLSRKGFDSGYGGMPSPILPDGRLLSLPIPARHDSFRLGDIDAGDLDLAALLSDLSGGRHSVATAVHLDPDLNRSPALRLPGWRPALGQTGIAQSHLDDQKVGVGDVFLFFGWFRQVERMTGRWRYVSGAPNLHVLFGWLEIAELLPIVLQREQCLARHPWIANHPHVANPDHYSDPRNTLYIAPEQSALVRGRPGGGVFTRFSKSLQLTAEGSSRSVWALPDWFYPRVGHTPLTYHANSDRWSLDDGICRLRSVAKGQEFVLDIGEQPEADSWIGSLIGA